MGIGCSNSKGNRPSDTIKNKETTENRNTIQKIESEISERQENFRSETKESKKKNKKKGKKGQGKKEHEEDYCEEWNGEQDTGLQNAKRENGSKRNEVEGMVKELNEECLKVLVKQSSFDKYFYKTMFNEYFSKTDRKSSILKVLNDIFKIVPIYRKKFMSFYAENKSNPIKVAIKIWNYEPSEPGEVSIRKLINAAIIIDAKQYFKDKLIGDTEFASNFLNQYGLNDVERIIQYSVKLMRLLNTAIVDNGTDYNTKDRTTYKLVNENLIKKTKNGEIYRAVGWISTFEMTEVNEKQNLEENDKNFLMKFKIPKGCYNAGKLRKLGNKSKDSQSERNSETLIPPYTAIKINDAKDKDGKKGYQIDVCFDNKTKGDAMLPRFS